MKNNKGFSIIDIMVAFAIISLVFLSVYELFVLSNRASHSRTLKIEASQLAQEGIESIRTLRNEGWTENIAGLELDTDYYLHFSGDKWTVSTIPADSINNIFIRKVKLSAVNRDVNGNISDVGSADTYTKKIVVTIEWPERGQAKNLSLETYITNFLDS